MKNTVTAASLALLTAGMAQAEEIKLGVLMGFTGPIESMAPQIAGGAEMAMQEVTQSGKLLGGAKVVPIRADSTCVDSSAATAAGERLVTSDQVKGIIGATCSGATGSVLINVAIPHGVVMISPSATSPALSETEDDGLFFRTAPSDARQGQVMAEVLLEDGVREVAVTYTNNDYGKGLADSFETAFAKAGGSITLSAAHEDGKADYTAEVGALASAGGDRLVLLGFVDQGGAGVLRAALDTGAFDQFHFADGMLASKLEADFGADLEGSTGQLPGTDSPGSKLYADLVDGAFDVTSPFSPEGYDAAALMLLAMQAAGSSDPQVYKDHVMTVANAPGEQIFPGELDKALQILADGGAVDYVGSTDVEMFGSGESAGSYRQIQIQDGAITTVKYR